MISLKNFKQAPRDYQNEAIAKALKVEPGERLLLAAPTGTGKGTIELALLVMILARGDEAAIVTPSLEVMRGYLERCGATPEDLAGSEDDIVRMAERIHVYTPVRLRNAIKRGDEDPFDVLIIDEAHHAVDDNVTGGGLKALCPDATFIGFTATPYRGTPEETKALRDAWGEPHIILTIPQAVENGAWALPKWTVKPIVDDDNCAIVRGDINADEITIDAIEPIADLVRTLDLSIPTCVTVPSVVAAKALHKYLGKYEEVGISMLYPVPSKIVLGETPAEERAEIYEIIKKGGTLLISVRVLGEGVDMPWLRRWVDASPTLSPVAFIQKLGRITRPNHVPPEYVGTNRNLERHGYLLQGALPRDVIKEAQEAFGSPSSRGGRAGMLKCVKKMKPIELPLAGGVKGTMWSLWQPQVDGGAGNERCIMLDPTSDRIVSALRPVKTQDGKWGKWTAVPAPEDASDGFKPSKLKGMATVAQHSWWKKSASRYGLDSSVHPTKAQFFALPVLKDLDSSMDNMEEKPSEADVRSGAVSGDERADGHRDETNAPSAKSGGSGAVSNKTPDLFPVGMGVSKKEDHQLELFPRRLLPEGPPSNYASIRAMDSSFRASPHRTAPAAPSPTNGAGGTTVPPVPAPVVGPPAVTRGYYTVVRKDGRRTYRVETMSKESTFAAGKTVVGMLVGPDNTRHYTNMAFADSRGVVAWKRHKDLEPELREDWKAIVGDPEASGKRYAIESGRCFRCGRLLTTPESCARGLGPICDGMEMV